MKSLLAHFLLILGFALIIIIIFDISEKIDNFLKPGCTFKEIVFDYYLSFIPYMTMMLSPLFIFLSVVFFTAKTANRTEIVAILSSGASFYRLLVPYMITTVFLASLSWFGYHYVLPHANKIRLDFENKYVRRKFHNTERHIHKQDSPNTFIYFEHYNAQDSVGYKFAMEKFNDAGQLVYKLRSPRVTWNNKTESWNIANYRVREINGMKETLSKGTILDTVLSVTPLDFSRKADLLENLTTPELEKFIESEELKGSDLIGGYKVKLYERNSLVFSIFILVLIGFSMSSRKVRGGLGIQLIKGLTIGAIYIFFAKICTVYAQNAGFAPMLAIWMPNIAFAGLAIYLLYKAPK